MRQVHPVPSEEGSFDKLEQTSTSAHASEIEDDAGMDIIYSTDADIVALFDAPSQEITESRHPHTEKITVDAGPTMNQTREEPGVVFYSEDEIAKMFGSPTVIPFIPDTSESSSHLTVPGSSTDRQ